MTTTVQTLSTSTISTLATPGSALRVGLWATQAHLALAFGFAGATKAFVPLDRAALGALAAFVAWGRFRAAPIEGGS